MGVTVRHKNPVNMAYLSIRGVNIRYFILPESADLNYLLIDTTPKQNPPKYPAGSTRGRGRGGGGGKGGGGFGYLIILASPFFDVQARPSLGATQLSGEGTVVGKMPLLVWHMPIREFLRAEYA